MNIDEIVTISLLLKAYVKMHEEIVMRIFMDSREMLWRGLGGSWGCPLGSQMMKFDKNL